MNLDVVWRVIYGLMRECIEKCCQNPPQGLKFNFITIHHALISTLAPVRELFERKNCRARFTYVLRPG